MRQVLSDKGWTAQKWATLAETSPTNITRALADDDGPLPNAETIARLAEAAGTQPDFTGKADDRSQLYLVPLLDRATATRMVKMDKAARHKLLEERLETGPVFGTVYKPAPDAFAVHLEAPSSLMGGLLPQDIAVVEPIRDKLATGALVVALAEGAIQALQFVHPHYVSHWPGGALKPLAAHLVELIGRIAYIIRRP
jgi:hypothetical protein